MKLGELIPNINLRLVSSDGTKDFNLHNDLEQGEKGLICSFGAGYSVCSIIVEKI